MSAIVSQSPDITGGSRAAHAARVTRLKLDRFRNYPSLDLAGDGRHVVLTGDNGAGKTNLLEALSFLSPGRGLRRAPYDRVAMAQPVEGFSAPGTWTVHAVVEGALGEAQIGTGLQAGPTGVESQRRIRVNSTPVPRAEVLLDHSRIVWLTPAMDGLFTGSASERRRFLDRMVLAIDPTHGRRVADFERAMRSRNRLLEDYGADPSWLTGVERQMAELGTAIAFARSELVSLLTGIVDGKPDAAFPKAELALEGTLEASLAAQGSGKAADLEDNYATLLARNRAQDRGAGRTLEGPHRTNLAVRHGPKAMDAALCSTGEQKALLTGLVLAHAQLVADVSGHVPILLLDEIAAHLDHHRREALFDLIGMLGAQAWMTGTDAPLFEALGERAQRFIVHAGTVEESKGP